MIMLASTRSDMETVVYIQEQVYRGDNDMKPRAYIFASRHLAYDWLHSLGYEKESAKTYPANQMDRWKCEKNRTEKHALVIEAERR